MMSSRLSWLLVLLAALLLLRWWGGPVSSDAASQVVAALPARNSQLPEREPAPVAAVPSAPQPNSTHEPATDIDSPINAFAVRLPTPVAVPPPPPPAPAAIAPAAVAPPAVQPVWVEPAPPLRVIGTWNDNQGPSVFLAGPTGTLHAHANDTLLAEFRVVQITASQVVLRHLTTQREIRLAVPTVSGRPFP